MTSYYGKIDLKNMPPKEAMHEWEKEARHIYQASCGRSPERFEMEYVWKKILTWQRAGSNPGRGLERKCQ